MTQLRILYLQSQLSANRSALKGRRLYDTFADISEDRLLGHVLLADEEAERYTNPVFGGDIVPRSIFQQLDPNVVYCEGGFFRADEIEWRVPYDLAKEYVSSGGILVIADADMNNVRQHKQRYREAYPLIRASVNYGPNDDTEPIYCIDESASRDGDHQVVCKPGEMVISDWLRPAFDGVDEVLVGSPVTLSHCEDIAASGNKKTTGTLQNDVWVDPVDYCPYASVARVGHGYAVFIAGSVSSDFLTQQCAGNIRWLINLCKLLIADSSQNRKRTASHLRSPHRLFLSHRSVNKPIVEQVAHLLKHDKGMGIWFDKELIPSNPLPGEISRALGAMTHFVLFWSKECIGAPWVERELNSASTQLIERHLPIIIVRLDSDAPVPPIISDLFRIEAQGRTAEEISSEIAQAVDRLAKRE